jgi:hypothetical protein
MNVEDSVLTKFTGGKFGTEKPLPAIEADSLEDLGVFGWLRGVRDRAIMLELRHKDGTISSYGYAWLKKAKFDPSGEIMLDFSGETVRITGRNLNAEIRANVRLFAGIVRHRVPWIQEADASAIMDSTKSATIIEELTVV